MHHVALEGALCNTLKFAHSGRIYFWPICSGLFFSQHFDSHVPIYPHEHKEKHTSIFFVFKIDESLSLTRRHGWRQDCSELNNLHEWTRHEEGIVENVLKGQNGDSLFPWMIIQALQIVSTVIPRNVKLQHILRILVQSLITYIFLLSIHNYKPCNISLKYKCPVKKGGRIRPTYLNAHFRAKLLES